MTSEGLASETLISMKMDTWSGSAAFALDFPDRDASRDASEPAGVWEATRTVISSSKDRRPAVNSENTGISETGQPANYSLQFEANLPHSADTVVAFLWRLGPEVTQTQPS